MSRVYTYIYHKENQPNIGDYTWVVVSNIYFLCSPTPTWGNDPISLFSDGLTPRTRYQELDRVR